MGLEREIKRGFTKAALALGAGVVLLGTIPGVARAQDTEQDANVDYTTECVPGTDRSLLRINSIRVPKPSALIMVEEINTGRSSRFLYDEPSTFGETGFTRTLVEVPPLQLNNEFSYRISLTVVTSINYLERRATLGDEVFSAEFSAPSCRPNHTPPNVA